MSSKKEKLLIISPMQVPDAIVERIRENHPKLNVEYIHLSFAPGENGLKFDERIPRDTFKDATMLTTFSALPPDPKMDAPKLEYVHVLSAGVDHISHHPIYKDTDVTLTTSNGVHGPQIAEWVIMTALVQSHNYNAFHDYQRDHHWPRTGEVMKLPSITDMAGQRIGVLGYGSIGRQIARLANAMGMEVYAYTATPKDTKEKRRDGGYIVPGTGDPDGSIPKAWYSGLDKESLHEFLKQGLDMLVISLPLTSDTQHLLSAQEFSILGARKTFISNISRGQILDQDALVTALKNGMLRGAALDVTDPEPLPEDSPLWDLKNVTITPHMSGLSTNYVQRAFAILEVNLDRREQGKELINVVNRRRGY